MPRFDGQIVGIVGRQINLRIKELSLSEQDLTQESQAEIDI